MKTNKDSLVKTTKLAVDLLETLVKENPVDIKKALQKVGWPVFFEKLASCCPICVKNTSPSSSSSSLPSPSTLPSLPIIKFIFSNAKLLHNIINEYYNVNSKTSYRDPPTKLRSSLPPRNSISGYSAGSEPPISLSTVDWKLCKYGRWCKRSNCWFFHPEARYIDMPQQH